MMRKKLEISDEKLLDCSWASTILAMHLKHRKHHLCTGVFSLMFPWAHQKYQTVFFFIRFFFLTKCLPIEIAILRQCLTNSLIFFNHHLFHLPFFWVDKEIFTCLFFSLLSKTISLQSHCQHFHLSHHTEVENPS